MVPDSPGARMALLFGYLAPDIPEEYPFAAVDRAAGKGAGYAKQMARGDKVGPDSAAAFAPVFDVTTDWILYGRGRTPGRDRVREQVLRTVRLSEGRRVRKHGAKVARRTAASTLSKGTGNARSREAAVAASGAAR